jgi:hypothetical protein
MGAVGTITHSPFSSAVPVPTTCPLLVTVTSLPEAARPAITSEPAGSTRTTSNVGAGAAGCDVGLAAPWLSVDGGTATCCVAVGAATAPDADDGVLPVGDDPADCWPFPVALAIGTVDPGTVVVAAVAVGAAAMLEAEALEMSGAAAPADPVSAAALVVVGGDVEAVPAGAAPAWAAPVLAVTSVFWPVAPAVVCDELAD